MKANQKLLGAFVLTAMLMAGGIYVYQVESVKGQFYKQIAFLDCSDSRFAPDDGDSLYCDGIPMRMLGIDTPEIAHVEQGISQDQPFGREARDFTVDALQNAKKITLVHEIGRFDHYCRPLVYVLIDGVLLQELIMRAGYAYENVEKYGDQGMSPYAALIWKAWSELPGPLPFENPSDWRKANQVRAETEMECARPNLDGLKM